MFARQIVRRTAFNTLAKRRFGAEAGHHPEKMSYNEWVTLSSKLDTATITAAERNTINARFHEARVSEEQLKFFNDRKSVMAMSEDQFQTTIQKIRSSPYSASHPLWFQHLENTMIADRTNVARPDVFRVTHSMEKQYTAAELGKGNYNQKLFNEYLFEIQNCPERQNKNGGALGSGWISIAWTQRQSLIFFWSSLYMGFYMAYLYRQMYIEKYNLWDMMNWESRVICAQAQQERGW